ncbi:hypothetical protein GETHLI_22170 [Geothrix limicola]|uniref:DUF3800 domain-containing protein n=1 Tax=Geothrix limicola TaxID=2927978 RepID=A0ABQ5QHS2_9BACT|nr:DUF3800 domain-containing protein [Geothrix limicola]GLH73715.1 hypothetical protein GETHLI_22170 [Geothrix limicola]
MHLLYCDETNLEKSSGDFFVYGGLVIPASNAKALHSEIEGIRKSLGVPRDYILKFNPGPQGFSHEQFIELKKQVIQAAVNHQCILLINLLLHDIAKSSDEARRFGINTLCFHFDCWLARPNEAGLVLIDRFSDKKIDEHLREKLAVGLTGNLPYSDERKLERVLGFHYTAIGQSHFCSLVDVIIGSMRLSINAFTQQNEKLHQTSIDILHQLSPLFFRERSEKVHEISLWFSPKEIKSDRYKAQYLALQNFLREQSIDSAQAL